MKRFIRRYWLHILVPLLLWSIIWFSGLIEAPQTEPANPSAQEHMPQPQADAKPLPAGESPIMSAQEAAEGFTMPPASEGDDVFISAAGLRYGPDPSDQFDTRIDHVMAHTKPDPSKPKHSVFVDKDAPAILQLLDEAWQIRGPPERQGGAKGRDVYTIDMGRAIGTEGETYLRLIVETGSSDVVTAYPVMGHD